MPKGGKQKGSGRKPLPDEEKRKQRNFYLTEKEFQQMKEYLQVIRMKKAED